MMSPKQILTVAGLTGALIAGGVIGATLAGPLSASATGNSSGNSNGGALQLTAATATSSAGTFHSNETPSHEAGESATVESQENSGQRPFGGANGKFTPNENAAHEAAESAAREAQENAGQVPTVP